MASGRSSSMETIRRVVVTLFFMLTMVGSLVLSSGPLFVSVSDVAVLLLSTTVGCSSCVFSASDWKEYSFSSSVIDIPLLSLIRSFIVMCAYSLCSSPSSYKPYLGVTIVCGVASASFLTVKAAVFSLHGGVATTVLPEARHDAWALPFLFLSSMAFGFAHIIVAQRARYHASRKLLFRWEDEEARMSSPKDPKIFSPRKMAQIYKLLEKCKRGDGGELPASALADADSLFMDWNGLSVHYKLVDVVSGLPTEGTSPASWKINDPLTSGYTAEQVISGCHEILREDVSDCRNGVVLIHGFGGGVFSWRHVMTPLARQTKSTVAAFDRPGWGVSSRPSRKDWMQKRIPNPYELESQVDLLFSLCKRLHLGSVVLVGHDDGGLLALMAAARASKSKTTVAVKGVVLVGVSLSREVVPSFARMLLQTTWGRPMLRPLLRSEIGRITNRRAWHDSSKLTADILELYRAPLRVHGWDQALAELTKASMRSKTAANVLQTVENLPALLVAGLQDMLVPLKAAQSLATKLPHSRFVGIPSCGHLPLEECPGALLAVMLPFILNIFNDRDPL